MPWFNGLNNIGTNMVKDTKSPKVVVQRYCMYQENTNSWAYGIPMVLGYKQSISPNFILAAEIGARYTFSDELYGSVPDADFREQFAFGNTNSNDWYVFTGITLTYTFGKKPCYCDF